jgi:hypothetical protein
METMKKEHLDELNKIIVDYMESKNYSPGNLIDFYFSSILSYFKAFDLPKEFINEYLNKIKEVYEKGID